MRTKGVERPYRQSGHLGPNALVGASWETCATPIGDMLVVVDDLGVREIDLPGCFVPPKSDGAPGSGHQFLGAAVAQLTEYFAGKRRDFDLPLVPEGTAFQLEVWWALADIAYGDTESYGSVAARVGRPKAQRAVGMANRANPLPIVLPCHRVIGSGGRLVGYGGGLAMKQWLLEHERGVLAATALA